MGAILMFVGYHVSNWYFTVEENSGWKVYTYIDLLGSRRVHKAKLCMPVLRSLLLISIVLCVNMSLFFFQKSGSDQNTGIITSMFTTAVIWTTVYFYVFFGQSITLP
jgi:hypothetical protein